VGGRVTTVWTSHDGVAAVVPVVDCSDRVVLSCGVSKSQEAPFVLAPVAQALEAEFGQLRAVPVGLDLLTDYGPQYTGSDCDQLSKRWQLDHLLAPVGRTCWTPLRSIPPNSVPW
jgi:transposase InsO family protein